MSENSHPTEGPGPVKIIYVLYLVAIAVTLTALVGVVMAYVYRGQAPDWLQSHYRFQIRTFWIGLLYAAMGAVLTPVLIGWVILLFALVWLIVRCVKGLQLVSRAQAHPDPGSWMFG